MALSEFTAIFSAVNDSFASTMSTENEYIQTKLQEIAKSSDRIYYGTTEQWDGYPDLIPKKGNVYIYADHFISADEVIPAIKVGDGSTYLIDLPFITDAIEGMLREHALNTSLHITDAERKFWNEKVRCDDSQLNEEMLIFTKN